MVKTKTVPPDGGYGWVIVLANALSNFLIVPLFQSFGLIFKDTFAEMGLTATQSSLIINLNAAFGMILAIFNGALLKLFGCRKLALVSAAFIFLGVTLTAFAKTFEHFVITYGIITSLGFGLNMSSYSLSLNSYFWKNKGKAVACALTITGIGTIVMPQVITGLIQLYRIQGAMLILAAISSNTFVAASLLRPVKWYEKTIVIEDDEEPSKPGENGAKPAGTVSDVEAAKRKSIDSDASFDDMESNPVYGMDSAITGSVLSLHSAVINRKDSMVSQSSRRKSVHSIRKNNDNVYNPDLSKPIKKKRFLNRIANLLDFDLLKDPIYWNILIGLAIAVFVEINFSVLTPFILDDFGLDTNEIATFLSVVGTTDIIFRFLAPYIGASVKLPPRHIYMMTLCLLIITRYSILISYDFKVLLVVAAGLGVAKGLRTVYLSLIVPNYVPIEKLGNATGLQMMTNGICIVIGGPMIGFIRDITGTYVVCIVVLNMLSLTTIVLWTTEYIILKLKKKSEAKEPKELNTLLNKP